MAIEGTSAHKSKSSLTPAGIVVLEREPIVERRTASPAVSLSEKLIQILDQLSGAVRGCTAARLWICLTLFLVLIEPSDSVAQITQIIDSTGDGLGNEFSGGHSIGVDASGNVFVTGQSSDNAFKISPSGTIEEIIDEFGGVGPGEFIFGRGLTVDSSGNVYVVGGISTNVFKIFPSGTISEIVPPYLLSFPENIAADTSGTVYVTASGSDNVTKISPSGTITEIIDSTGDGSGNPLQYAYGIAVDASANVYVTGHLSGNAFKVTPDGTINELIDATGDGSGNILQYSYGISVDSSKNVYVGGLGNVFKISPGGTVTMVIDATGDGAGNSLEGPTNVVVDAADNLYVVGGLSDNVFMITPSGVITEIIDSSGDGSGNEFGRPSGAAVDSSGNVYVTSFVLFDMGGGESSVFKIAMACGDGFITGIELCDDVGTVSGDGCDSICQIEPGWVCAGEPSACAVLVPGMQRRGVIVLFIFLATAGVSALAVRLRTSHSTTLAN